MIQILTTSAQRKFSNIIHFTDINFPRRYPQPQKLICVRAGGAYLEVEGLKKKGQRPFHTP